MLQQNQNYEPGQREEDKSKVTLLFFLKEILTGEF